MTKAVVSIPNFSAGELSPRMYGRFDLAAYYAGARRMQNFIPQVTGPARYRTGTIFASRARDGNKAFLFTFNFNDIATFILEFTPNWIRFYDNQGIITETAQNVTNITQANEGVLTYSGGDNFSNGDRVIIENVSGMTQLNNDEYEVENVNTSNNTFTLKNTNTTGFDAYTSGGTIKKIVEVSSPYTANNLFSLKFAQNSADLYIAHPSHNPKKLSFISVTNWSFSNHSPIGLALSNNNYPSAVTLYEERLIYGGSNNNPQTLFFSKSGNLNDFTKGTEVDDGIEYTVIGGGKIEWIRGTEDFLAIGAFQDVLKATGGVDDVITPTSISIKPTNSFGVADINPIGKGSQIFYMQKNQLVLRSLEYVLQQDSFFPVDRNTIADHITKSGVTQIAFEEGRPNIVWGIRNDGSLIGMTLEDAEGISGWHRHDTDGKFISITSLPRITDYDQIWVCVEREVEGQTSYYIEFFADPTIFTQREDFVGVGGTETLDNDAFARKVFEEQKQYIHMDSVLSYFGDRAGNDAGVIITPAQTNGTSVTFTASSSFFSSSDVGRKIWRKSIDGKQFGVAEITSYTSGTSVDCDILEEFDSTNAIPAGEWYITAGTVTGLTHLEGEEVTVVTDGGQHPKRTVTDGQITLATQSTTVHVGFGYRGFIESNDLEGGGTNGPAQTKRKSINAVGFRFFGTLFVKFGTGYYNLKQINERNSAMLMDRPPLPFTGDRREQFVNKINDESDGGWQRQKRVIISQELPFPCNVQLVIPYMNTSNV